MNSINNRFKISVIVPVYNAEEFLEETIESVVNQTIGFKDNIQLILINDGSKDNSEKICLKYKKLYPDNIIYEYKENGGVSSARNLGRKYVEAKYFNFLDSDDKWALDAFKKAYNFFENHYDEIDVLNVRTIIFGGKNYKHPLDYKFNNGARIIDLNNEYESIQLGNAACFFKTEALKNIYHQTNLITSEDTLFMGQTVMNSLKYGVLPSAHYYYRRLTEGGSLSSKALQRKEWYTNIIKYCHQKLIDESIEKYGFVQKFIQYTILYELQWRIYKNPIIDKTLTKNEIKEYRKSIVNILKYIDDDIILNFKNRKAMFKFYLLSLKYDKDIFKDFEIKENKYLYFNEEKIYNLTKRRTLTVEILEKDKNNLILKGNCGILSKLVNSKNCKFRLVDDKNNYYDITLHEREYKKVISFCDEVIIPGTIYMAKVPIDKVNYIKFEITDENNNTVYLKPSFGKHSGLSTALRNKTYRIVDKYLITYNSGEIVISNNSASKHIKSEIKLLIKTLLQKKLGVILMRLLYYITKLFYKKPIWFVRDKFEKAGDNGESVFKYLSTWEKKDDYNIYFILRKDSVDYERLKKYGKIIDPRSLKYKLLFLLSSKIIDSVVIASSINPFGKNVGYYRDLFKFDFVGLFHGIGQRDMSFWTNDFNYNIKVYVSGAEREYKAMISEDNGYDENIIKFTGLPRFDELENKKTKEIAFMPTWRNDLAGAVIKGTNKREYREDFKNSDYFKFYNSLINNKKLISKMKQLGYTGVFYNHPNLMQQVDDFEDNDTIKIAKENASPNDVISNCALLVTDYSSAAFECAYLNKPVIYTQFDYADFVERHTGTGGYFDYGKDSFGPVCHDEKSSVDAIIKYIEKDCVNDKKYQPKIDKFFLYRDKNNSKRLVDEVVKYDERKKENSNI